MEFDRAQAKRSVRQAMRMTRPRPMLVTLLFTLMVSMSTGVLNGVLGMALTGGTGDFSGLLVNYMYRGYEIEEAMERAMLEMVSRGPGFIFGMVVGGMVLSAVVALWQGLLNVGYTGYALSMSRGENPPLERLFCSFPIVVPALITRILTGVFIFLWSLLLSVGWFVLAVGAMLVSVAIGLEILMVLFLLALMVALWLGIVWVELRYALVDYVLLDKGLSGMDAIRESKRLMKGRMKDAFLLQLSFIGWYLLLIVMIYIGFFLALFPLILQMSIGGGAGGVVVSVLMMLGIGGLTLVGFIALSVWLRPYTTGCMARFYDWADGRAAGRISGPGFGPGPGSGGWGQPTDYTWTTGPTSGIGSGGPAIGGGTGTGGGNGSGGSAPRPPKPPQDDPWD